MKSMIFIIVSIILGAFAQISMKWGTVHPSAARNELVRYFLNIPTILGLGLYGLSAILWILALQKVQLSFAYPMVALGYVLVTALSYFIFKEEVPVLRVGGLAVIVLGVLMIAKS